MLGEVFDPKSEFAVNERLRPHWSQAGAIVFITFRTRDSIPREVLSRWNQEKQDWLKQRGVPGDSFWKEAVGMLDPKTKLEFLRYFNRTREDFLDTCQGSCLLKNPSLAQVVFDSLLHFDGERYQMGDFVIMPNHVHLLAAFPTQASMEKQLSSWLSFSARVINHRTGGSGHFWQQEPFDHLVRSIEQYNYLREYIANIPIKARLPEGEFRYYRRGD